MVSGSGAPLDEALPIATLLVGVLPDGALLAHAAIERSARAVPTFLIL